MNKISDSLKYIRKTLGYSFVLKTIQEYKAANGRPPIYSTLFEYDGMKVRLNHCLNNEYFSSLRVNKNKNCDTWDLTGPFAGRIGHWIHCGPSIESVCSTVKPKYSHPPGKYVHHPSIKKCGIVIEKLFWNRHTVLWDGGEIEEIEGELISVKDMF
jgi:hypothetical protein